MVEKDGKVTYTICQGSGCGEHCVIKVFAKDGKIERTERAILKGPKADRYEICHKGILTGRNGYQPERLLYPLKRVGERGEGKFERVSWDQALAEIGEKLTAIREKYGPRSLVVDNFSCGIPGNTMGALTISLCMRFYLVADASVLFGSPVDVSSFQSHLVDFGDMAAMGYEDPYYWTKHRPNYLLLWGLNPIGWNRAARTSRMLMDAQEKGTKLVDIGLIYDSTAAKCDEFVAVRAGQDTALALAMANVIIQDDRHDIEFLNSCTVAPFLVRNDTGLFLRESDIDKSVEPGYEARYVVWNKRTNSTAYIAAKDYAMRDITPDILAEVEVGGIGCKTAFVCLKEHVAEWTPETQAEVTGVSADTCRRVIRDYLDHSPSGIFAYFGLRYSNGGQSLRAVDLLAILSGNIAKKNGRLISGGSADGYPIPLGPDIVVPEGMDVSNHAVHIRIPDIINSIDNPNTQQYKALICAHNNPLLNHPNRSLWVDTLLPNFELVVVNEIRETDTTLFADYVLPEAPVQEREDIVSAPGDCLVLLEPAVEPRGESRVSADLWRGLAESIGLGDYFQKTQNDWVRMKLDHQPPELATVEPPITYERLKEEKIIALNTPEDVIDIVFEKMEFPTFSGRIEFYSEEMAHIGRAMATYQPARIHGERKADYPIHFFPGRSRFFMQGQFTEHPELRELAGKQSTIRLNPKTAKDRGIKEGDMVEAFNERGVCRAPAHLSNAIPPDMAYVLYAYPAKDYTADPPTALAPAMGSADTQDDFSRAIPGLRAKLNTNVPDIFLLPATPDAYETFWDELVEIRKA